MKATLLFDTEMVVECYDCGTPSSASVTGRSGWALRPVSAQRLVDVCPDCQPRRRSATTAAEGRVR